MLDAGLLLTLLASRVGSFIGFDFRIFSPKICLISCLLGGNF